MQYLGHLACVLGGDILYLGSIVLKINNPALCAAMGGGRKWWMAAGNIECINDYGSQQYLAAGCVWQWFLVEQGCI